MFPSNVKSKWPAIIFAESRIANVPGRIILLVVSINTIKGVKAPGVPSGTRWASICWVLFNHPKIINLTHSGKARARVIDICLVLVKTYGSRPKKLLNTIKEKSLTNIKVPLAL